MERKRFNLEEWLQNKSRKVVTRDGRPARILCTDAEAKDGCCVIAAIETNGEEEGYPFFKDGRAYLSKSSIEDCSDLFFADDEEELTEFEKEVAEAYEWAKTTEREDFVNEFAPKLLDSARKKIEKENQCSGKQKQYWSDCDEKLQSKLIRWQEEWLSSQKNGDYMDNGNLIKSIEEPISWLKSVKERVQQFDKEIDKAYRNQDNVVYNKGYEDVLKSLRWKKFLEEYKELDSKAILLEDNGRVVLTEYLERGDYYLTLDDLKTLPKEEQS